MKKSSGRGPAPPLALAAVWGNRRVNGGKGVGSDMIPKTKSG